MIFNKTDLAGIYQISPEPKIDFRGYFMRSFCKSELQKINVKFDIKQINRSFTLKRGTIRGLHFQRKPYSEDKIIQCLAGKIFDVAIDLRPKSVTYGKWTSQILSSDNQNMLFIPKGFAHGFQSLTDKCLIEYFVSQFYNPKYESGIKWNDPIINIKWPLSKQILSDKDKKLPFIHI
jgi:dTDP-4-dehydrorhamnose 3,5-epimerase